MSSPPDSDATSRIGVGPDWEGVSRSIRDITAWEHIRIDYGWDEDQGYYIKVMDERLEMEWDWRDPYNMMAELDRFKASILDGGQKGCYLSAYTGPRGQGKQVDYEVMISLWSIYKVPTERNLLGQMRNMSKREIDEVIKTVDEKILEEWENPWECAPSRIESEESEESEKNDGNEEDEDT